MTHRYALRFEEGERRGEVVALTGATTTFGRKPGNTVQVLDPSVSGKHAELVVDASGALLRDLGSTNGTRVNGERISERRIQPGDRLMLGTVDLVFLDMSIAPAPEDDGIGLELESDAPAPRAGMPPRIEATSIVNALRTPDTGEGVRSIGAEKLAKSGKKSAVAALGLIVIALGGGAAWWFTRGGTGGATGAPLRAVADVPGNLLATGYSFEGSDLPAGWESAEDATAAFEPDRGARASGAQGLSADLEPNTSALLLSPAVAAGRPLELVAALGATGRAEVRAGIRFESSTGACLPAEAWGQWISASEGADQAPRRLAVSLPPLFDRARALVAARASAEGGAAQVDDVALVPATEAAARVVKLEDVELHLLGDPATAALLFKIDHALLGEIRLRTPAGADAPIQAAPDRLGMRLSTEVQGAILEFTAEAGTAAGGIATTGNDGFKTHQAQFERAGVDSVVLGAGRELVRVRFDAPVAVRGRPGAGGTTFVLQATGVQGALVQVTFNDDRVAAEALAREARAAARAGEPSRVIGTWSRLINEHPIDANLIKEAEEGRAKALSEGLAAVAAVRADVERARFFRLLALFRECRAKSLATAESYAGSEVEAHARALATSVEQDIDVLARDLDQLEARRLAEIHAALVAAQQPKLAGRVAAELAERFDVDDPAALLAPAEGGGR